MKKFEKHGLEFIVVNNKVVEIKVLDTYQGLVAGYGYIQIKNGKLYPVVVINEKLSREKLVKLDKMWEELKKTCKEINDSLRG